jgi:hypothetical protein
MTGLSILVTAAKEIQKYEAEIELYDSMIRQISISFFKIILSILLHLFAFVVGLITYKSLRQIIPRVSIWFSNQLLNDRVLYNTHHQNTDNKLNQSNKHKSWVPVRPVSFKHYGIF